MRTLTSGLISRRSQVIEQSIASPRSSNFSVKSVWKKLKKMNMTKKRRQTIRIKKELQSKMRPR